MAKAKSGGDLNFRVGFETEQAAASFQRLFQDYINGSQRAGDEANKLLGGTVKKNVEVRLEVNRQSGAKELTTIVTRARTELDKYEKQFRKSTAVEPGSLTNIRQALNKAKQARDAIRQFADYSADAAGQKAFKGPETEGYIRAQKNVKDLENQLRSLQAASGGVFDKIRVGLNLDTLFKAGQQLNDIVSIFQSLQIAIGAVTAPVRAVTQALADLQSFSLSFQAIGAGASGAQQGLSEASRIALGLGVNIKTVREAFQQLSPVILNSGGNLGDVSAVTEALSSRFAAFGLNADRSRRVMNGVIQAFSKGKLMAEELTQQISEADPAFKTDLAKALNVTTQELEKMVKAGDLTSDVLIKVLPSLSKSALLFGKLGDSATSAVDAFDRKLVPTLAQVQNNIANISQLNLEAFAKISEPIISAFLRAQATVTDFVSRISQLETVKALANIFASVAREAVRVADVFLRVAEGFLIVITPLAKLVNLLLEIPGASTIVGLAIVANLLKPLAAFGASINENILSQNKFAQQLKQIWGDIGKPFTGVIDKIKEVNRAIGDAVVGKKVDPFKGVREGAGETNLAIRNISQTGREVTLNIQRDFDRAFDSAKVQADQVKKEFNQLRKVMDTGTFVPMGSGAQRSLRELRAEADTLRSSFIEVAPAANNATGKVSKFRGQLIGLFGDVTNRIEFDRFKTSIGDIQTTQPIRALGLLQAAIRELGAERAKVDKTLAPSGAPNVGMFYNTKSLNEAKSLVANIVKELKAAGVDIAGSLRGAGTSFNEFGASINQVAPVINGGLNDVSKFKKELSNFGDIKDPKIFESFKRGITNIRATDPIRALGLLQAAFGELSRAIAELPVTGKRAAVENFLLTRSLNDVKSTMAEVTTVFDRAETSIPNSMNQASKAVDDLNNSFNKLNADKLLLVESQIAEGEAQLAGKALALRESLNDAEARMTSAGEASKALGRTVRGTAAPALEQFSRQAQLFAQKSEIENRLDGIRKKFKDTVTSILRDSRTLGKLQTPGGPISGADAAATIAGLEERGTLSEADRQGKLKRAIEERNAAQARLIPTLQSVNNELEEIKLNKDAAALFPKDLAAAGVIADDSAKRISSFGQFTRALVVPLGVAEKALKGLAAGFKGLVLSLGPIGVALIAVQVLMAAWTNGTKGQTEGLRKGQVAVDAYAASLKELENITLSKQAEQLTPLQQLWNDFSVAVVDGIREIINWTNALITRINQLKPPKWVENLGNWMRQSGLFDQTQGTLTSKVLLGSPEDTKTNTYALRQFRDEIDAVVKKSKEARANSEDLAEAIRGLGAAASTDESSKQRQINAYVQFKDAVELQRNQLEEYKKQLNELNAIEASGAKLTAEQEKKRKLLSDAYVILNKNVYDQVEALRMLGVEFGYLAPQAEALEGSIGKMSEKLKEAQEKLNNLAIGDGLGNLSKEWIEAVADVIAYEAQVDHVKKTLSDPLFKQAILDTQFKTASKELDLLSVKIFDLQKQIRDGFEIDENGKIKILSPAEIESKKNELTQAEEKLESLMKKVEMLRAAKVSIKAEVDIKVNMEGFRAEVAAIQRQIGATQFLASINGAINPEFKSAATTVAQAFDQTSAAAAKFAAAGREYKAAVADPTNWTGQVLAAQNVAKEGLNYKLAIAQARANLTDTLNTLRQGLKDAVSELLNLKLNNLSFLPIEQQRAAIRQLNQEVQRIAEQRGLVVTFTGTADQILKAKQQWVDFYNQLDKGENKISDLDKAIQVVERALSQLGQLKLGEDGELFKKSIEASGEAALAVQPYMNQIAKDLENGKTAAQGIAGSLLGLDGKTITVRVVTTGVPNRWAGGPVEGGKTYRVNELGREGFLNRSGKLTAINRPKNALWRPGSSGTVIPAHIMRSFELPQSGINVTGSRIGRISNSMNSVSGSNALIRELRRLAYNNSGESLRNEMATTHASQAMEIGKLTRAVRDLVNKNWNISVGVKNSRNGSYIDALNRRM